MENFTEKIVKSMDKYYRFYFLGILLLVCFNLFFNLGALPVQNWDEARTGLNAYEMVNNHDFIRMTYLNEPDYWNSKPPLAVWTIALSYTAFGFNVFALRFPSALAGLFCIILAMIMARDFFGKKASLFTGIVLATSYGFMNLHGMRSGNFDGVFVLLVTLCVFCLSRLDRSKIYFFCSALFLGLAFLAKSFAILQILGIFFIFWLIKRKELKFTMVNYLFALVLFVLPVLLWALWRYSADGFTFFQKMIENDLIQRTTRMTDGLPTFSLWYVFVILGEFFPWSFFLIAFIMFKNKLTIIKNETIQLQLSLNQAFKVPLLFIWILVPFAFFSLVTTKVDWYMIPIYPALAIVTGWFLAEIMDSDFSGEKRFFTKGRIMGSLIFLTLLYEGLFIFTVTSQDRISGLKFFMNMPHGNRKTDVLFFIGRGRNQDEVFMARVIGGYQVKKAENIQEFLEKAETNAVLFDNNNTESTGNAFNKGLAKVYGDENFLLLRRP